MLDLIGVILGLTGNAFIICLNDKMRLVGFAIWALSDVALVLWSPSLAVAAMYVIYGMFAIVGMVKILTVKKPIETIFSESDTVESIEDEMEELYELFGLNYKTLDIQSDV